MKKIIIIIASSLSLMAMAQDRKVAVFDPAGSVPNSTKEIVREEISSVIVNALGYTVLERALINKVLEENKFQAGGLVDDSQISEIGKRMGANLVFVSSLTIMDNGNYYVSCKMIDVLTARIEKQKTARTAQGSNDLINIVQKMVEEMFVSTKGSTDNITQNSTSTVTKPATAQTKTTVINQQTYTVFEELGLIVMNKDLISSATWIEAKNMCAESRNNGFNDWYLPSKNELVMIFETKDQDFLSGLKSSWYWSSTDKNDKTAYNVNKKAWVSDEKKKEDGPACLCVRKIQ